MVGRAAAADVPSLVALLRDDALGAGREQAPLSACLRAFEEIDTDPTHYLAVIRDGSDAIVGTAQLSLIPGLSRGGARRLLVEGVRLASGVRGSGLGTALFRWIHEYGAAHGAALVQLTSDNTRIEAHRFYERLGYAASHTGFKRLL